MPLIDGVTVCRVLLVDRALRARIRRHPSD
jgi:hypothetical protein